MLQNKEDGAVSISAVSTAELPVEELANESECWLLHILLMQQSAIYRHNNASIGVL